MPGYLSFVVWSFVLGGGVVAAARVVLHATGAGVPGAVVTRAQDDCPPTEAFSLADHWSVSLHSVAPDQVWPRLRQALGRVASAAGVAPGRA